MKLRHLAYPFAIAVLLIFGTGCGNFLPSLRPDLNDTPDVADSQPTVGGRWSERGFLNDGRDPYSYNDHYDSVGHSERSPASNDGNAQDAQNSWVSADRRLANERDQARGRDDQDPSQDVVSFSNTPNLPPPTKRLYKNGSRATRDDFVDDAQNEGSLWASDGQSNYFFSKNKVRGVGDILTVTLENDLIHDIGVEVKRTLSEQEKDIELQLAQERANARILGANGGSKDAVSSTQAAPAQNATPNGGPAPAGMSNVEVMPADIDVAKSLELKAGDPMMAEIVERYPNGNYKIRGNKKIIYRNGTPRLLNFVGVVRGTDIGEDDTVPSGKLYEYQLAAVK
jgi:flagellar L-ring protein precursor FlgH